MSTVWLGGGGAPGLCHAFLSAGGYFYAPERDGVAGLDFSICFTAVVSRSTNCEGENTKLVSRRPSNGCAGGGGLLYGTGGEAAYVAISPSGNVS